MARHARAFDWKAGLAVAFFGGLLFATHPSNTYLFERVPEQLQPYKEKYGPRRNSEHAEEWLIRDFFGDARNRTFVDVGANDYRRFNNTYYLEVELGWSGVAVEPQVQFSADYQKYRPRTRFRPFFVSDASDQRAQLYVLRRNPLVTSAERSFTERFGGDADTISAPTITLDDLLEAEDIQRFDLLSMDIELWEPRALAGFDIDRFRPSLVCIEAHPEVRQAILDYFGRHGYAIVEKYVGADNHNLYFSPAGTSAVAATARTYPDAFSGRP